MDAFNIKFPVDWDKWWGLSADRVTAEPAFTPCRDDCECEDACEDEREERRLALADAAIALAESNKVLAQLIDALYGEL